MSREKVLGRGLAALLGTPAPQAAPVPAPQPAYASNPPQETATFQPETPAPFSVYSPPINSAVEANDDDRLLMLNVYEIDDNPFQPRRDFSEPEIASLAESLKEHDMLQPILVRKLGERFQLISGERRLRAAIKAGWQKVPARLRVADDRLVSELAIVENLQRQDLNAIEKALSFKRYLDQHECTQEELAGRLKLDRSTIANLVRLLELPDEVLTAIRTNKVSPGHARALLPLGDETEQRRYCQQIQSEGLSVRTIEKMVAEQLAAEDGVPGVATPAKTKKRTRTDQVASLEQELRAAIGAKTEIKTAGRGRGQIVIHFTSYEEFDRLRELLVDAGPGRVSAA
ncbi:MAG TPA: ParB/RepB/Spo0J family partition protein [Pirellulaceae bacterium]|nr:ParB/RepB/Spo0J family partition protein [Pirellulaceae bacterium]